MAGALDRQEQDVETHGCVSQGSIWATRVFLRTSKESKRPDRTRAAGQARLAVCFGRFSLDACSGLAAVASAIGKVIRCRYD